MDRVEGRRGGSKWKARTGRRPLREKGCCTSAKPSVIFTEQTHCILAWSIVYNTPVEQARLSKCYVQASSHGCNCTLHHGSNDHPTFLRKRSDFIAYPKISCTNITCFSKARMSVPDPNCSSVTVFSNAMSDLIYRTYKSYIDPKWMTKKRKDVHELSIFCFPNLFQSTIYRNCWLRNFHVKTSETML